MELADLRKIPEPEVEARIASRRWALARLKPLPASWSPKATRHEALVALPDLLRFVTDAAPLALASVKEAIKDSQEATKALRAKEGQLKQLAAVAAGGK